MLVEKPEPLAQGRVLLIGFVAAVVCLPLPAQEPIGRTTATEVQVSGAVDISHGETLLGNGSQVTAGDQAVSISLQRGGSLHLCSTSSVYLANKKWVLNVETVRFRDAAGHAPQMDAFDKLVGFCADHHIHLIVFLQPLHSMLLDRFTTDWSGYSDWVKTAVAHMESHPGLNGQFWDFTSYNSMSTESFPAPTDKYSHMRYYWEGSHYRKIVGDTVLQRIFTGAGPSSFGRQITSATVGDDLQRLADEQSAWHDRHQAVQVDVAAPAVTGL